MTAPNPMVPNLDQDNISCCSMNVASAPRSHSRRRFSSTSVHRNDLSPSFDVSHKRRHSIESERSTFRCSVTRPWYSAEVQRARGHVEALFQNSALPNRIHTFPKFTQDECSIGKFLGKGTFGTVHEINEFSIRPGTAKKHEVVTASGNEDADEITEDREFIAKHSTRTTGETRYAIKCLNLDFIEDQERYWQGAANMAIEARMLSAVEHPNIIKLRAVAACNMYKQPGFFLIMDRLYETLDDRLLKWRQRNWRVSGLLHVRDRKGVKKAALLEERLVASFDLSAALEYLHKQRILHRDLKPGNIGFDIRGDIKLFDFSMATELRPEDANNDGTYNLTMLAGSLRYMAPEVAKGNPYNESCDVYSFAIVFWEMYALKKPFCPLKRKDFMKFVVNGNTRPHICESWPISLRKMLKSCWSPNLKERLSMKEIACILKKEITTARGGNDKGLEHARRRSTFVYCKASGSSKKLQ